MTIRILVACDGNHNDRPGITLESCRGFLPLQGVQGALGDGTRVGFRAIAALHDWTRDGARDLCPSCSRARARRTPIEAEEGP